ncbi:MAG: hypothetical protein ACOVN5_00780 [Aquidulcibacter sp.]|jgi:hypothetical protein
MNDPTLKPAMLARLVYLDQCLTWRGQVNRKDLIERFGISSPQAAIDFREYLERVADPKPRYDAGRKYYVADPEHRGLPFTQEVGSPDELVRSSALIDLSLLPSPVRHSPPFVMRHLYQALEQRQKIEIDYVSMSSGLRQNQWIAPANFASDGERLHVRAWSFHHQEWRDYLPVRVSPDSIFSTAPIDQELPPDVDWEELIEIRLRPINDLSDEQKAAVRLEYGFTEEVLRFQIRRSLEFYVERRWGLDRSGARLERC